VTDKLTPYHRSENMRRIRSCDTSPEMCVRRLVHGMGFRYRLHVANLPGKPDLVFRRLKKIIEVRGCFWHQHKKCIDSHIPKSRIDYWRPKLTRNKRRDRKNELQLREQGWDVLTLWECELKHMDLVSDQIAEFLGKSIGLPRSEESAGGAGSG
jgi:DNA mismatch endonuclease, patch repair protein